MVRRATAALIPLVTSLLQVNALIFELPSHTHRRHAKIRSLNHKVKRDPVLPDSWSYLGCYGDGPARTLAADGYVDTTGMTVEACVEYCDTRNYLYAGLEYSQECFCDNAIQNGAGPATGCSMQCSGDPTEVCGGGYLLSVYASSDLPPAALPSYNEYSYQGCYTDSVGDRTLPVGMGYTAPLTPEKCIDACKSQNYLYAGLEYSVECYCGNEIAATGTLAADPATCNMVCEGDNQHLCGGPNRLTLYKLGDAPASTTASSTTSTATTSTSTSTSTIAATTTTTSASPTATETGPVVLPSYGNWLSQGCWSDDPAARSLPIAMGGGGETTPQACMDACYNAGYGYAGVEYSVECFCGTEVLNGGSLQSDEGCNMLCAGDDSYYCGGPNRLNLYQYQGTVPPPPDDGPDPDPDPVGPVGPQTEGLPEPWAYSGCWVDNAYGRILSYGLAPSATNSPLNCIAACADAGFILAGLEYSQECYCGNALANGAEEAGSDGECNMACSGDDDYACGGPGRVSLYAATETFPVYPVPTALTTDLPGQYEYAGCVAEPGGGLRIFPYQINDESGATIESCLNLCSSYGYAAAGMEFGYECWCGDPEMVADNGGYQAPEGECDIPCSGDPLHVCGGVERINLYTWSASNPLYVWHTPENTGHYEFLIGGVVIPLIATLAVNDKVVFLEKYGTGPPNSTGAYELDYMHADDFEAAWRTMHVMSDVFCAANVVLPDKAGRILSVGGWSLASTEGVRLYAPTGSPGVPGTTDWEENWEELRLQQGRWYPTAMVMANGSVLVVGGEEGSNGAPVPSIEVLPTPEGGPTYLTMDWLLRTDPYNLYPFLYVLPGGGIFIMYFNEARILNEVTMETEVFFPIIPGAVNEIGGRTYPMEGTSVMLPQYAPYTDPVEILACGGSAYFQALDNCVSIVPEAENPEWIIERMPSRRVMTVMAPLPDGTFMIMGGAKAGQAGFGLASDPNLEAILYDPSKPRHQRFSRLGSTIVPRMYHSEATLLHDGRVLLSGSDPEDGFHPQEYRIEVYVPPYLTDGRIQPSYTIENRDWAYNGQYDIEVTLPQGPISEMRVSLIGAISSTHGGSFGQRTLFPAFTCAGTTCTITAPPDPHVCPPGWFQLFVLDGPTPSYSTWVRIGGDPGELGNWPNTPSFTPPGMGGI